MKAADPANAGSKQPRGRFRPGQSGNPAGKARGTRHRITTAAEMLLEGEAEALTRKAVEMAKAGDTTAMRLCLERIYPVRKGRPMVLTLPTVDTAADVNSAMTAIIGQMAAGDLTAEEASTVIAVIDAKRKAIETEDHEQRIAALEAAKDGRAAA